MTDTEPIQLRLLGPFAIEADGSVSSLRRKTRALVAYLATTGQAHPRRALMNLFCQEAKAPGRALAVLLSRIRKQLGDNTLFTDGDVVQLNFEQVAVDVTPFLEVLDGNLSGRTVAQLQTAVSLYRADFLDGLTLADAPEFELWLLAQQAQMRHLLERGLMYLIRQLIAQDQSEAALAYARRLVQHNPLLEEGHAQLMWLYAQLGRREAALRQFDQCQTLLQTELAVAPMPELQTLRARIEAGQLGRLRPAALSSPSEQIQTGTADFVGRDAEIAKLHVAWQAASSGRGQIVLLAAPAGAGKSRLMAQFRQWLPQKQAYVGHCYELTRTLPYQPWLEILEAHLQQLDDAALQQLPPATQSYLSRLLPALARRLPPTAVAASDVIDEPERLFTAVVDFLCQTQLDQPKPRLLFLDDLQWADEISLRLLHYVGQRVGRFPWLLVGAYRSEEVTERPSLRLLLDEFAQRDVLQLTLAPLTPNDIERLTAYFWPQLAPGYRGHIVAMLAAATGGNALFVTAVLQELATSDDIPTELPVPATVQDLMQRRLRRLSPGGRQVLEALAVLGGGGTLPQLQQISARGEAETEQALEWGLQWGVVTVETPPVSEIELAVSPTTYQFQHDLVREAVYATLSTVRQQRLHRRTAVWLARIAQRHSPSRQQEVAGRILYHAQQGEAFDLIFQWAAIAAAQHRQVFAYRDALHVLDGMRDAYEQLQYLPNFDPDAVEPTLFEALVWWLSYSWMLGKSAEEEQAVLQLAQEFLSRHPSPRRTAQLQLVTAQISLDQISLTYEETILVAQSAQEQFFQLNEPSLAAEALLTVASASITLSRNKDGRSLYEQALALFQQANDGAGEVRCLTGLAWTALNLGETAVARQHLQRGLAISQAQGDKLGEAQALFGLAAAWGFYHAPEQMTTLAAKSRQLYEEIGFQGRAIRPLLYLGAAHGVRENWPEALAVYEAALAEATAFEDSWVAGWVAQLAGRIYLHRGELAAADAKLRQAQQLRLASGEQQNQVSDLIWLARLSLAQGHTGAALSQTAEAVAQLDAFQGEFYVWEQPDVLLCRAETLAAAGQLTAAHEAAQQAHACLHQFAQQITEPDVLAQFMAYPLNVRVEMAVASQQILPWPER